MQATGQHRRIIGVEFNFADFPSGVFTPVFTLPNAAKIIEGSFDVRVASDAGTTDTIQLGVVGTPARNLAATSAKAVANTALTATTAVDGDVFGITRTVTGTAATVGKFFLYVEIIAPGIHDFLLGDLPGGNQTKGFGFQNG